MKTCPHCDTSIPNPAEQCPHCRQYLAERRPGDGPRSRLGGRGSGPDADGRRLSRTGALVWVIGVAILVAGSGAEGGLGAAIGRMVSLAGVLIVLVGVFALGVRAGLRRHADWLERREP